MSFLDNAADDLFMPNTTGAQSWSDIQFTEFSNQGLSLKGQSNNPLLNISQPIFLFIAGIQRLPAPENLLEFADQLKAQIIQISEEGHQLGYPSALIDKLCCLHSIVLDEFILHSHWGQQSGWENRTLLSQLFGLRNGGELFFDITQKAIKHKETMREFLEVVYQYLLIGFQGRYRNQHPQQLYPIIRHLQSLVEAPSLVSTFLVQPDDKEEDLSAPPVFSRSLLPSGGIHLFSVNLLIALCLTFSLFVLNYWYQESYSLRAAPFIHLQKQHSEFGLKPKAIIYNSTLDDILPKTPSLQTNASVESTQPSKQTSTNNVTDRYWVQLASLKTELSAQTTLQQYANSPYPLFIAKSGRYYVIYTTAQNWQQANSIRATWKKLFGEQALIIKKNTEANTSS